MLTVIIPTIQKKPLVLGALVNLLKDEECVSEVIVINNTPDIPIDDALFTEDNHRKIRILYPDKNLYVNPSWNMGVRLSKNENFALFNDDLLVCKGFCQKVIESEIFNAEDTGLIGLDHSKIENFPPETEALELPVADDAAELEFVQLTRHLYTGNWGSVIFGKKSKWNNIPSDFRVIYGDNYILKRNLDLGRKNYEVRGMPVYHIASSSSKDKIASNEVYRDCCNASKYFKS